MEVDEFDFTGEIFDKRGATLDPVAAVEILHVADGFYLRAMDVAADDAVGVLIFCHQGQRLFVAGDVFDGGLGFEFQISGDRPVTKTEHAAQAVEVQVEVENPVVDV